MQIKHLTLILAVAAAGTCGPALAQTKEDPSGAKAAGKAYGTSSTKSERQEARRERRAALSKENKAGELRGVPEASGAGPAPGAQKYSREERRAARQKRLKESGEANRSGEIRSGDR